MMLRRILILSLLLVMSSCSGIRRAAISERQASGDSAGIIKSGELSDKNIVPRGLFVRKLQAEIEFEDFREKVSANLRVSGTGEWLLSIRNFAGIEIARILADRSEVLVLDRVGRTATIFSWAELKGRYGLDYYLLPLLLGDVPVMKDKDVVFTCGEATVSDYDSMILSLIPDCKIGKLTDVSLRDGAGARQIIFNYGNFEVAELLVVPRLIEAKSSDDVFSLRFEISDIEIPWDGTVELSIPENYRIIK